MAAWLILLLLAGFDAADTTPPVVNRVAPAPDSTVSNPVTIRAALHDGGSGIDLKSLRLQLDGRDVTADASIDAEGVSYQPGKPLSEGIHRVELVVTDRAGNSGNRAVWRFGIDAPVPIEAKFENDVFLVNGEPYFPIGIYSGATRASERDLRYLIECADAGCNFQWIPATTTDAQLDVMLKHGQKAALSLYYPVKSLGEGDRALLDGQLARKDHPAILTWLTEYPNTDKEQIEIYAKAADILRQADPNHPVAWVSSWVAYYKPQFVSSDVAALYFYPIIEPEEGERRHTVLTPAPLVIAPGFAAVKGTGKQVWFLSQAFDYRIGRDPQLMLDSPDEVRPAPAQYGPLNYLPVVKGVKGLVFYASGYRFKGTNTYNAVTYYRDSWEQVLRIASELRYLSPILAAGEPLGTAQLKAGHEAIHFREWRYQGVQTLIAVNVKGEPVDATWRLAQPARPKVLFEDRVLTEPATELADRFAPLAVHIYQWPMDDDAAAKLRSAPSSAPAAQTPVRKKPMDVPLVARAVKTDQPPTIDGNLDEPCWQDAPPAVDFVTFGTDGELAQVQTRVRFVFTGEAIYIGVTCDEPAIATLVQHHTKHDAALWNDDSVEVWLDTNYDRNSAYHLIINPRGAVYDAREWHEPDAHQGDESWDSDCEVRIDEGKSQWTIEVRIAVNSFDRDPIAVGRWGLNLLRTRRGGHSTEMSSWTGVPTQPKSKFGTLLLMPQEGEG